MPSEMLPVVAEDNSTRRASLSPRAMAANSGGLTVQEFYRAYNIDISQLNAIEQSSTRMRVTRLLQAMNQNDEEEAKILKLEGLLSGKPPPDTPMIVKIVDDLVKRLIKITTSMSSDEVKAKIYEKIGTSGANLAVELDGETAPLTDESLEKAASSAFQNHLPGFVVHVI